MFYLHSQMDTCMNIQLPTVNEQIKVQPQMFEECLHKRRTTSEHLGGPSVLLFCASNTAVSAGALVRSVSAHKPPNGKEPLYSPSYDGGSGLFKPARQSEKGRKEMLCRDDLA